MSELEQLIQQRNEIQKKIQEIKRKGVVKSGDVKLDKHPYGGWYIAISVQYNTNISKKRWQTITCNCINRKDALEQIPQIIEDLQNLYNMEVKS